METCLSLDSTNRELQLAFKKTLRHSSGLQFKVDGVLNTVTTDSRATAKLSKVVLLPLAPAGESGKRRTGLRISLGARVSTTDKRPMITMDAKQKVTLLSSSVEVRNRSVTRSLTQAVARSTYDMDPQTHKGFGVASVALQHTMFEALPDQDIRVSLGATFPLQNTMVGPAEPFLKIQENCWGLMLTRRQGWKVTYDL